VIPTSSVPVLHDLDLHSNAYTERLWKINSLFSLHTVSVLSLLLYWQATEVMCESTQKKKKPKLTERFYSLLAAGIGHFLCGSTLKKERIDEGIAQSVHTYAK